MHFTGNYGLVDSMWNFWGRVRVRIPGVSGPFVWITRFLYDEMHTCICKTILKHKEWFSFM